MVLSAGPALPLTRSDHAASASKAADATARATGSAGVGQGCAAIVPVGQSLRPGLARLAVLARARARRSQARVAPGSSCAWRNRADGWHPDRNMGGAHKAPAHSPAFLASASERSRRQTPSPASRRLHRGRLERWGVRWRARRVAIYHLTALMVPRSRGHSVVQVAASRSDTLPRPGRRL